MMRPHEGREYRISRHVRERYLQRFGRRKKYGHLDDCRKERCAECESLGVELRRECRATRADLDESIRGRLAVATEERSFVNNLEYLVSLWKKYGYHKTYTFRRERDAIFVVGPAEGPRPPCVVTVIPTSRTIFRHLVGRAKYRKKEVLDAP